MQSRSLGVVALVIATLLPGMLGTIPARAQSGIDGMRLLGRNEEEFAHVMDIHLIGDYAYTSIGLGMGLEAYDISDPTAPIRVFREGPSGWRAWAQGDTIYNFCHKSGVQLYDISAGVPVFLDGYEPADADVSYEGGVRIGDLLYIAAHQRGLHIVDVGSSGGPFFVSELSLAQNASWNVVESDGYLLVANGRFGLSVIDLSGAPMEVATLELSGLANDIAVSGDRAYLSLAADGVVAVDISDPLQPLLIDQAPTLGNAFSLGLEGDILAVGSYPYAERFDVSNPAAINLSGWDATKVYAMGADAGVNTAGDTLIAVADWRGIAVYAPTTDVGGDIEVFPMRLDFGAVGAGAPRDTTVLVRNSGAGSLSVTAILPPGEITVDPSSFSIGPGGSQEVVVTASGSSSVRSTIGYISDDPDEPDVRQDVYKNNLNMPQVGSVAPDFSLVGTDGNTHTLSDYRGKVVYLEFAAAW